MKTQCVDGVPRSSADYFFWAWWGWEPIYAIRRSGQMAGGVRLDDKRLRQWYGALHSETIVKQMAEHGINCAVTHFYKGFGFEFEEAEMERTARFVSLCHKHGIKVFGYLQYGSIFHEAFFKEKPEAVNWKQTNDKGLPNLWCGEYSRYTPCVNSRTHVEYLKKIMRYGIEKTGLDGFHFDNFYSLPCHCGKCRRKFRGYLERHCDPVREFGLPDFDHIIPPPDQTLATGSISDPLVRHWVEFRQEAMNALMDELRSYATAMKNGIMLLYNPNFIRGLLNQGALRATDIYGIGRRAQYLWAESGNFPGVRNKCLVHQAHYFKTAEALGYKALSTTWLHGDEGSGLSGSPEQVKLNIAESAAFGGMPGSNWALRASPKERFFFRENPQMADAMRTYFKFIKTHIDIFSGSRSIAPIAFYLNRPSMFFHYQRTCGMLMVAEQILLQNRIPFDLVFRDLERLSKYRLVILPELVCLDRQEARFLASHAEKGGKVLLLGKCGVKDESNCDSGMPPHGMLEGSGITGYSPKTEWLKQIGGNNYLSYITLPDDNADFVSAVLRSMRGKLPVTINTADPAVIAELRETAAGEPVLHLVNYNNHQIIRDMTVTVNTELLSVGNCGACLSPDFNNPIDLPTIRSRKRVEFTLPELRTYAILRFKYAP